MGVNPAPAPSPADTAYEKICGQPRLADKALADADLSAAFGNRSPPPRSHDVQLHVCVARSPQLVPVQGKVALESMRSIQSAIAESSP
jgi:hypothetical protein